MDYSHLNIFKRIKYFFKVHSNIRRLTKNKNKEIESASENRLFDLQTYRTNFRTNKVAFYDIFFLLFHLVLVYAHAVESGLL